MPFAHNCALIKRSKTILGILKKSIISRHRREGSASLIERVRSVLSWVRGMSEAGKLFTCAFAGSREEIRKEEGDERDLKMEVTP
jgi:hypothetical protein